MPSNPTSLNFSGLPAYEWLQVPMWVFDTHRFCIRWGNAAAETFWGAPSRSELLERDFSDMSEATRTRLTLTIQGHVQHSCLRERWTLYPHDRPVSVYLMSRNITTPEGYPAILFAADSTQTEIDPSLLRGIEALQHTSIRIALFALSDGRALMRNPAAALTFGERAPKNKRTDFSALFVERSMAARVLAQIRAGQTFSADVELQTHQGPRWHSVDARPIRDPVTGDKVLQFNARDIADLKATQIALESARRIAEEANLAKSRFLANISHEIRTPMNGVLGLTELVLQTDLSERQYQFISLAHQSAHGLLGIINDLLDVAKIEAERLTIERAPFLLRDCIENVLQPLSLQAQQKHIELSAHIEPDVPDSLVGDALRLRQILINLVGNAIKFTEQGGVVLEVKRRLQSKSAHHKSQSLVFTVRDSGIGMSQEQIKHVFEPFTQADSSITRRFGGTGLGLTIVHRLVQLMDGQIEVESEAGRGSEFRFQLNFALGDPTKHARTEASFPHAHLVPVASPNLS